MNETKVNLFIYGSLRDPQIFKSVSGLSFTLKPIQADSTNLLAEPAFLPGYRKVTPDNVYFYAVANPASRIEGTVIYNVPASALAEIDRYEGKRYDRETVRVHTAKGTIEAQAYLTSHESMKKHFGDRFHVNLIHELWLRKRIEKFIEKHTRPGEHTVDAELERRAKRELLATTERDLVISHYRKGPVSDYFIEHELDRPLPSIKHLYQDHQAQPFIENYLSLVVKQVLLNQLDEKIQSQFRFEIERMLTSERYFRRSKSMLAALRMINDNKSTVDLIIRECLKTMPFSEKFEIPDE
ncbi:MAG: gamma-glutamylcyclotransferase, partial [Sedimentisphaerales bacterium]|nr:gamma-glutamylcyclotransferase [Sedimentisphaerales bacterium]